VSSTHQKSGHARSVQMPIELVKVEGVDALNGECGKGGEEKWVD
jgi:hypothetical protein